MVVAWVVVGCAVVAVVTGGVVSVVNIVVDPPFDVNSSVVIKVVGASSEVIKVA